MKLFLVSLLSSSVNASLPLATPSSTEKLLYTRRVVYIEWLERPKRIVTVPFIFAQCKCTFTLAKISDLLFSKKRCYVKSEVRGDKPVDVFTWPVLSSTTSIATSASPDPQSIPSAVPLSYQIHVKRISLTDDNLYPEVALLQTGLEKLTI